MRKETNIINLEHHGRGVAKENNIPTFIENALPGEKIIYEIIKDKKKYKEGKILEIIEKSKDRVNPICPYYNECGGCNLMHINYEKQLEFKENKLKEILEKFKIKTKINEIIKSEPINYRNKITLKVDKKIGLYKRKSNELINITNCLLADSKINDIIKKLSEETLNDITEVVIKEADNKIMIQYKSTKENITLPHISADSIYLNDALLEGNNQLTKTINDIKYVISPNAFFQVNYNSMHKLYQIIKENCGKNKNILDLYCGSGTIGLFLAQEAKSIVGIEINENSIRDAEKNKIINKIENIEFKLGPTKKIVNNLKKQFDVIIVDPPRAGLDNETIDFLNKSNCKKIIYVSCDPFTLARDLKILESNYIIQEVTPVDMFPNTYHVECVVTLNHK